MGLTWQLVAVSALPIGVLCYAAWRIWRSRHPATPDLPRSPLPGDEPPHLWP